MAKNSMKTRRGMKDAWRNIIVALAVTAAFFYILINSHNVSQSHNNTNSTYLGTPMINVSFNSINSPMFNNGRSWAVSNYTRNVRVWLFAHSNASIAR